MLLNAGVIASSQPSGLDLSGLTIPAGRQSAVIAAAESAASGQAFSAQDVIDALVACDLVFDWWNAYTDTAGTTPASDTNLVAAVKDYVSGALLTQSTSGNRPIYNSSGGLTCDGSDDVLPGSATMPTGTSARCLVFSIEPTSSPSINYWAGIPPSGGSGQRIQFLIDNRSGQNHYQFDFNGSNIEAGTPSVLYSLSSQINSEESPWIPKKAIANGWGSLRCRKSEENPAP